MPSLHRAVPVKFFHFAPEKSFEAKPSLRSPFMLGRLYCLAFTESKSSSSSATSALAISAGWNLPAFPGRKRKSRAARASGAVFDRNQANLEAETLRWPSDRKNELFGVGRFEHFLHQKRSGDKDRTSEKQLFCMVFRPNNENN